MFHRIIFVLFFCVSFERATSAHLRNVVVDFASEDETFRGNIHVSGKKYPLTLQRAVDSVLAPNFRLTETIRAPSGKILLRDIPLTKPVSEIERNIYVDENANAAFAMTHVDGEMRLHGIMDNVHISHDGLSHVAAIHDFPAMNFGSDYLSTNLTRTKDNSVDDRAVAVANPELFFTIDYKHFLDSVFSADQLPQYLAIMIRGVNSRYKTVSDPSIKFKIVGSTIITSAEAQPFIEEARGKGENGVLSMEVTVRKFGAYMFKLRETNDADVPKHDLAPLLSTEDFGIYLGLAFLGGACQDDDEMSIGVSVATDKMVSWLGLVALTHELAHSLGAAHDEEDSAVDCPATDGFFMGKFSPENHLTFSSCSRNDMKAHIISEEGACLREDNGPEAWTEATKDPGWYVGMDEECSKRYFDNCPNMQVKWDRSPDEMCSELICECPETGAVEHPDVNPPNGTPCGYNDGRCHEGKCVA